MKPKGRAMQRDQPGWMECWSLQNCHVIHGKTREDQSELCWGYLLARSLNPQESFQQEQAVGRWVRLSSVGLGLWGA